MTKMYTVAVQKNNTTIFRKVPLYCLSLKQRSHRKITKKHIINDINKIAGPINFDSKISRSIGPKLGRDLLINGGISLLVSLIAISFYISIRFDKKFSFLAYRHYFMTSLLFSESFHG